MSSLHVMAVAALLASGSLALAATDPPLTTDSPITRDSPNSIDFYAADQFTYDDNLYRLPAHFSVPLLAGPQATRDDGFNSVSLGGDGRWFSDIQALDLDFRVDDNRYIHNDSLNNISGKADLEWDWRLQSLWSGQVGASYYRGLANFADTGYYARDVVQRGDYFGTIRYQVGPHWAVYGGYIGADTTQTAVPEQLYDFHSNAGNAGIEFATSSQNTVTLDYRYTNATFPQDFVLNDVPYNSDYKEQTARVLVKYVFTAATELDVSGGYLKRDYPEAQFASFGGAIWKAALQWQPTDSLQWVLTGWRQLNAYVDAESDYFVSNGASLAPVWTVSQTLSTSLTVSWQKHDYLSSSPTDLTSPERHDTLTSALGRLVYAPLDSLSFKFSCGYDKRDSNQPRFQFNDTLASLSVTYKIRP
jgi:Putative beta-barrel porin 2